MFIVKIHIADGKRVIALCDKDVLNKKFEEGEKQLDVTAQFYQGEEKTKEEVIDLFTKPGHVNAIGKESVTLLVEQDLIDSDHVREIAGIPYGIVSLQ
tara:strand:+ start:70 stop:363 length:294 start_codon:yes stop_codon:yes gene_type:complete